VAASALKQLAPKPAERRLVDSIELIERWDDVPLSPQEWNSLVARNDTDTVFQTYEWCDAWWRVFGRRGRLFFLLWRVDGQPAGFAPLMLRRNVAGLWQLELIGTGNADYQDFVFPDAKAQAIAAVGTFLRQGAAQWDRMRLCNVPEQSSTLRLLTEATRGGLYRVDEARLRCPALVLHPDSTDARALINKYSLRRPQNWFAQRGTLIFRHVTDPGEIQRLLPVFFDQHNRRWRAEKLPSIFESQEQRTFYQELATAMQRTDSLLFSVVEFDGKPIAFHFGFDYRRRVTWYKPSFEIDYSSRSPGLLLTRALIQDALERSRSEFDFSIGDEKFKQRFANIDRFNLYASFYRRRVIAGAAVMLRNSRRLLARARRLLGRREI